MQYRTLARLHRFLTIVLCLAALDTVYLSWRFTALHAHWVTPGTGLCSWTDSIDCDKVLQTPEARTFVVPNAILGLAFYTGALLWWLFGLRLGPSYRPHLVRSLAVWLGIASLMTFWFWYLLLGLDALCPFCPWNHVLTYLACGLAVAVWRRTPHPAHHEALKPLLKLVAICVTWFWAWIGLWFLAEMLLLK
jgi:uncharacterized membrane protein